MQRMMIITADNETAEVLSLRFELQGFVVECVRSPDDAISQHRASKPSMCIIDVRGMKPDELERTQRFVKKSSLGALDAVLLMPAVPEGKRYPLLHRHAIVRKPYDLTSLTRMVSALVKQQEKKPRSGKR